MPLKSTSETQRVCFGKHSSVVVWIWLASVGELFVTLKYINVQVGVYALYALNLLSLTVTGGVVKIIEEYTSQVNFHSNLWPECLFWTFKRVKQQRFIHSS